MLLSDLESALRKRKLYDRVGPGLMREKGLLDGHQPDLARSQVAEHPLSHASVAALRFDRLLKLNSLHEGARVECYIYSVLLQVPTILLRRVYMLKVSKHNHVVVCLGLLNLQVALELGVVRLEIQVCGGRLCDRLRHRDHRRVVNHPPLSAVLQHRDRADMR